MAEIAMGVAIGSLIVTLYCTCEVYKLFCRISDMRGDIACLKMMIGELKNDLNHG